MAQQGGISEQCQTVVSVERAAFSWNPERSRELTLPRDKSWTHPTCWDPVSKNHKIWLNVIRNTSHINSENDIDFMVSTFSVSITEKQDFSKVQGGNNSDS